MIEKTLTGLFKVVADEAESNKAFAAKLEASLAKFAEDYVARAAAEGQVADFHPFIEFKKSTPEEYRARLGKFDVRALRLVVKNHGLDPAGALPAKATKKAVAEFIAVAAEKRAARDAKLFEY
jgi:hypothetical protein